MWGDHCENVHAAVCPVIMLIDELERLQQAEPRVTGHAAPNLFDAIRYAQSLTSSGEPLTSSGERAHEEYVRGQAELICAMFGLHSRWRAPVAAEIRQEHGKWAST